MFRKIPVDKMQQYQRGTFDDSDMQHRSVSLRNPPKPSPRRKSSIRHSETSSTDYTELPSPIQSSPGAFPATENQQRLVIAVDFGTTFTGVAYSTPNLPDANLQEIDIVADWGPQMGNHDKIPSVISYSPATAAREQQWGASIAPDSVTMVNPKLELDIQENKSEELELILQVLDGMNDLNFNHIKAIKGYPEYTWKSPEQIVTDYLTHVFQYVESKIDYFGEEVRATIPVDIVITVPVRWSHRAKESTHRAVRKAGFNERTFPNLKDIIMVTEPEAAAVYTARHLKKEMGKEFLKVGQCFILCDAGGGTVDVVSYRVKQLEPNLDLEALTLPYGDKCGSIYIDNNFKKWLRKTLGEANYRELDPRNAGQKIGAHSTEGRRMREVMKEFDKFKRSFPKKDREMRMDLPEPLDKITIGTKVVEGELIITSEEMKDFFDPCVDQIIALIEGQISQVERKNRRVRNIFLVGGFGESEYLQKELDKSMARRNIHLWRPNTSWTAVVRGAVVFGIEKTSHSNITIMKSCEKSFGLKLDHQYTGRTHDRRDHYEDTMTGQVMAKGQLTWLIRRGDLVLSDVPKVAEKVIAFNFMRADDRNFALPVYEYPDDDIPDRFETAHEELREIGMLLCDFTRFPIEEFERFDPGNGRPYFTVACKVKMTQSLSLLTSEIIWNEMQICKLETEIV